MMLIPLFSLWTTLAKEDNLVAHYVRAMKSGEEADYYGQRLVARSKSSVAVEYMSDCLRDPKASQRDKHWAFTHLADTGGAAGLALVRQHSPKKAPLSPWPERFNRMVIKNDIVSVRWDKNGRTWRLLSSSIFGNGRDLFVQQKHGSKWLKPIFTGKHQPYYEDNPQVESGWETKYPTDKALTVDSDRDGLADNIEKALGTSPNLADTDGDGIDDSVDPCPINASRPLGEDEKIFSAAIVGYFFGKKDQPSSGLSIEGIQPFDVLGYDGQCVWDKRLSSRIRFVSPDSVSRSLIKYSQSGTKAEVTLRRYFDTLDGSTSRIRLKKYDDDWFVVDIELISIS